jgi:hypothetical protein
MTINRLMNKQTAIHPKAVLPLSHRKKWSTATWTQHTNQITAKRKNPDSTPQWAHTV